MLAPGMSLEGILVILFKDQDGEIRGGMVVKSVLCIKWGNYACVKSLSQS